MMSTFDPEVPLGTNETKAEIRARPSSNPSFSRMTNGVNGAFTPTQCDQKELPRSWHPSPSSAVDTDDTEDDEVKINCIGGLKAYEDSDMSSDESVDDSDEEDETEAFQEQSNKRSDVGLVHFVGGQIEQLGSDIRIERPEPLIGLTKTDKSDDDESSMDDSDSASVGGRGLGLSLESAAMNEEFSDDEVSEVDDDENSDFEDKVTSQVCSDPEFSEPESGDEMPPPEQDEVEDQGEADDDSSTLSVSQDQFEHCDDCLDVSDLEIVLGASDEMSSRPKEARQQYVNGPVINSHPKRVLSASALDGPSIASSDFIMESPKRMRCKQEENEELDSYSFVRRSLSPLSLGPSASERVDSGPDPPTLSPIDDVDEQDRQLSEELKGNASEDERTNTPIPLLTPPASPVQVDGEEGPTTICEWPSNLTIDSALTAAIDLRPPSPSSLQTWEQQEEERLMECTKQKRSSSTLTPLIRGISVNLD